MEWRSKVNKLLIRTTGFQFSRAATAQRSTAPPRQAPPRKRSKRQPQPKTPSLVSRKLTAPLPVASIPRGEAVATNFFDDYDRFFTTSQTTPQRIRLNLRYEAIFGQNRDLFDGARVLDIASHDGRWSLAALKSGASEVIGIEARQDLVSHANDSFAHYGIEAQRYRFIAGDIYQVMDDEAFDVDVVLCLGFMYHTLRYNELMSHIARCRPRSLLIDGRVIVTDEPVVLLRTEPVDKEWNAVADRYSWGDRVLSGRPSMTAIETMVNAYGFDVERRCDWTSLLRDNQVDESVDEYADGQRVTLRCAGRDQLRR